MENEKRPQITPGSALHRESQALGESIEAIRKAAGKKNPDDFPAGTSEWQDACDDFARDMLRALGVDPDDDSPIEGIDF
jgi:hypothetical protein